MVTGFCAPAGDHGDNFRFERHLYQQGYRCVAGCDEAGRGPLAGPVVAACVVLPLDCRQDRFLDSKILSPAQRRELHDHLREIGALTGVGIVPAGAIDRINILQASLLAMRLAVEELARTVDFILVDGKFEIPLDIPQAPLIKGETKSASIAAASIVAKVTRDRIMEDFHNQYPVYNFHRHKGYPTKEHRQALATHGPCPIHRMTFNGVVGHDD